MAEAFRGEFYQKVDGKARVSIPAAFRAVLNADDPQKGEKGGARLYMVYGGKTRNFVNATPSRARTGWPRISRRWTWALPSASAPSVT